MAFSRARSLSLLLSPSSSSVGRARSETTFRRPKALAAAPARQIWGAGTLPHLICRVRQAAVVVGHGPPHGARRAEGRRAAVGRAPQKKRGAAKTQKVGVCENRKGAGGCGSQKWFCTERGVGSCAKTGFLYKRGGAVLAQQTEKEGFHLCEDWVTRKQLGQHKHGNVTLRG